MSQYTTTCLDDDDCPYKYHDPTERAALKRLRAHIEETGHEVALQGVYDSPREGGVHSPDGHRNFKPTDFGAESPL